MTEEPKNAPDNSAATVTEDRRSGPRVPFTAPVEVMDTNVAKRVSSRSPHATGEIKPIEEPKKGPGDSGQILFEDRRSSPRYAFTASAEVVDTKSRTRMNARVSDLSRDGCYVDTNAPFPVKTNIRIRISSESSTFETMGTVVYSLPNMGMGISFGEPKPEHLAILKKWIGGLSGETPFEFDQPDKPSPVHAEAGGKNEQLFVLQELVITLMRKGTLSSEEGKAMLQKLLS